MASEQQWRIVSTHTDGQDQCFNNDIYECTRMCDHQEDYIAALNKLLVNGAVTGITVSTRQVGPWTPTEIMVKQWVKHV